MGPERWDGNGTGPQACGPLARPDVLVRWLCLQRMDGEWIGGETERQGGGDAIIQDRKMAWPKAQSYLRGRSD